MNTSSIDRPLPAPASASAARAAEDAAALFAGIAQRGAALAGLHQPLPALSALQSEYLQQAGELWNQQLRPAPADAAAGATPGDARFGPAWSQPQSAFMARLYLLNARTLLRLVDSLEGDAKARARLRFAVQQWVDAAAPSNFLALNPQAQELAFNSISRRDFFQINSGLDQHLVRLALQHIGDSMFARLLALRAGLEPGTQPCVVLA